MAIDNPLGSEASYPTSYNPDLLYPIPRWPARSLLDIDKKIQMYGLDHWQAFELSWLNLKGKPQVAIAELFFNCESENIVESKSLKLYLNSFNQERIESIEKVVQTIQKDLSLLTKSEVKVIAAPLGRSSRHTTERLPGSCIDSLDVEITDTTPNEQLLICTEELVFDGRVYSDLFKSNCPVTGQPDWASVSIQYTGMEINNESLLRYLCSFRSHQGYHEECAERIYRDIMVRCQPSELLVAMNYLRRGGIDINVYRSTTILGSDSVNQRLIRQ
ncbi:MAG: NADPH-dependent 7-cyano-7-deazaguanine reductase QueF [Pseudohongiellaceae bacterium]